MTRPRPATIEERFWVKVAKTETCWLWTANKRRGYGLFTAQGRTRAAHRWLYEQLVGPIPAGLELDHLCRVRNCVNPQHLEPVTTAENHRRRAEAVTECPQGHPYSPENTILNKGRRSCRICGRAHKAAYKKRKRVERRAARGPVLPRTHCDLGHELAGDNLLTRNHDNARVCRTCFNRKRKEARAARKAVAA